MIGQVEATVAPVEQVVPSVQKAAETVTAPAQGATAGIVPAAKAPDASRPAGRQSSSPTLADLGALPGQVRSAVTGAAAGATTRSAEGAVRAAKEEAEAAAATLPATVPSANLDANDQAAASPTTTAGRPAETPALAVPADSSATPTDPSPPARRTTYVPPPAQNGATGPPLPRWAAYVWPAVALTGPFLAHFAADWKQASADLAPGASGGSGAAQGVAGVHASGGQDAVGSSPLFSRFPSLTHAFASVPTPLLIYLGLLTLAVIAVALAVRREIVAGRRL